MTLLIPILLSKQIESCCDSLTLERVSPNYELELKDGLNEFDFAISLKLQSDDSIGGSGFLAGFYCNYQY